MWISINTAVKTSDLEWKELCYETVCYILVEFIKDIASPKFWVFQNGVFFWIQVVWDVTVYLRVSFGQNIEGSQCLHLHWLRVPRTSQHHVQEDPICHSHTFLKPKLITETGGRYICCNYSTWKFCDYSTILGLQVHYWFFVLDMRVL